ncbi:hypothetical protein GGE12_001081 [Rhizobium mongolense]|uniref:Uncharacterized protein n=1 Tax=Rhizobium mongolense TaxID=57676 RepID=A0A7W6RIY5_9HYPH|nr:hypothetical protein [Rhizobium mongolense]
MTVAVGRVDQHLTLIDINLQFIGRLLERLQRTSYRNRSGAALWEPLRDRPQKSRSGRRSRRSSHIPDGSRIVVTLVCDCIDLGITRRHMI